MSTRTVIEINHDYLHDILTRPEEMHVFLMALRNTLEYAERCAPNGIKMIGQRHHSEATKLTLGSAGAKRTFTW